MKESEDHDGIVIFFRDGDKTKVIMFVKVEEIVLFIFDDGFKGVFVKLQNFFVKDIVDVGRQIGTEMSRDEDSAFFVQDVDGRDTTHSLFKY